MAKEASALLEETSSTATATGSRLNVLLSEKAKKDLQRVADSRNSSLTAVVRLGLALIKLAFEETEKGNKLMITDQDGRIIKEVVLF